MRIVLVSRGWFPLVRGGAEKFISRLAEELRRYGHEVIGVTRWLPGRDKPRAMHPLMVLKDTGPKPLVSGLRFSTWAARVAVSLNPDVVVVNGYWDEATPLFIRRSVPVVTVIHDVGLFESDRMKKHKLRYLLIKLVLRRVVVRANTIIVPTRAVKQDIIRYLGGDPRKIHVLGFEGVDGPFRRVHEDNGFFDIVQVARFAPNKGQLILLEAFKYFVERVSNARLWLIGGKPIVSEYVRYLERVKLAASKMNKAMGREVVRIIIDAPSVDEYYRIADVCVAPSICEEGYGLTIAECLAYGKPVIASDIFIKTGVASREYAYIFPRGNVKGLVRLLTHVYSNYGEALRKAEKGLEYVRNHSWQRVAEKILNIIQETVARG